jgi:tight adherence protein C
VTGVDLALGLLVWAGAALLISCWGRLRRPSLADRLMPFHPGGGEAALRVGAASSPADLVLSGLGRAGDRLASLLGISEGAARRLDRVHSATPASAFRGRQAAAALAAGLAGAAVSAVGHAPLPLAVLLVVGSPLLCFLVLEQRLTARSEAWQRATEAELPVVAEQMAMLLNAGFSVGSALGRLGERSQGVVGRDLQSVVNRIHQGLNESEALQEWAGRVRVEGVSRLVAVLTLHSAAADIGRLVTAEARATRRDLQRRTLEQIERRSEQVWVPVTVATLVPGAILLAVPFLAALHQFSG